MESTTARVNPSLIPATVMDDLARAAVRLYHDLMDTPEGRAALEAKRKARNENKKGADK